MPQKMAVAMNSETSETLSPASLAKTAPILLKDEVATPAHMVPKTPTGEMANSWRNLVRCGDENFGDNPEH